CPPGRHPGLPEHDAGTAGGGRRPLRALRRGRGAMRNTALLGPWVRRFLLEYLRGERNLARNTQRPYRDTLRMLLPVPAGAARTPIDRLQVEDLSADRARAFLREVEEKRGCGVATRNQRLAALHSLAHFIGLRSPEHVGWCGDVRAVPFK